MFELEAGEDPLPDGRVRRRGGGRKAAEAQDPDLVPTLLALVEPDERGDPMSPLRWTTKSLRDLAHELTGQGHPVSAPTVGRLLKASACRPMPRRWKASSTRTATRNSITSTSRSKPIRRTASRLSAWTRRRRSTWAICQTPAGSGGPEAIRSESKTTASSSPARTCRMRSRTGSTTWPTTRAGVNVGVDHDTSAFAVESIRRWWRGRGSLDYPNANRLLITADCGGSNSYRYRLWKAELADFAAETGLAVTVCHFPPGTSKWNKIEHRLFSHITMNWRGRPLTSHEVVVNSIAATRTRTGLTVAAELDTNAYPLGVSVSAERMSMLPIVPHIERGAWNNTIGPADDNPHLPLCDDRARIRSESLHALADPPADRDEPREAERAGCVFGLGSGGPGRAA
ncbi:hypothetical protein HD596_006120 [Nonomuraea jabiensis]|uniref:Rhodopirellula transposase DDE domain-containing protein n=1 Tax=Nonomuraea jabiensis TaxID=882448 RepID=A0A7W9G8Z7_9ACTN|nr:hypothetical protein [Nonomuraea jabiensis]